MKKCLLRTGCVIVAAAFCLLAQAFWGSVLMSEDTLLVRAQAAEINRLQLVVQHQWKGVDPPENEIYRFVLTPDTLHAPMPEESRKNRARARISGDGFATFGTIAFRHPGCYVYRVQQEAGKSRRIRYDGSVYHVQVFITENQKPLLIIRKEGKEQKKEDSVLFANTWKHPDHMSPPEKVKNPPKTGDIGGIGVCLAAAGAAAGILTGMAVRRRR